MHVHRGLFGFVLLGFSAAGGFGADRAYVTSPSNEILEVDFDARTTKTVVRDRGKNFQALAVRRDGADRFMLVVASTTGGGDLRIYDPASGQGSRIAQLASVRGVALSLYGHLFSLGPKKVVFAPRRTLCDLSPIAPGCFPGGYGALRSIDDRVEVQGKTVQSLADLRVANTSGGGLVEPGELVVLVQKPPMVIAYTPDEDSWTCAPGCEPRVVVPASGLEGRTPTGLEIASNGVLITTSEGTILRAHEGTTGLDVTPFAFLPGTGEKLSVGVEGGVEVVYATVSSKGGSLHRFEVSSGDPLGSPITKGIEVPHGVGNDSSSIVLTAEGTNVKVVLPTMQAVFDQVTEAGATDARCNLYPAPADLPRNVLLSELGIPLAPGTEVVIPAHVTPFRVGDPDTGQLAYYICIVENGAAFANNYQLTEFEDQVLEYEPRCETFNAHPFEEARMFYAPDIGKGEDNIAEATDYADLGNLDQVTAFTDVSTDCGCNIGRGWKFSFIMPAASSTLPVCGIESDKIAKLAQSVTSADFLADFIEGPGCGAPGILPPGVDVQPAFTAAGLGSVSDWTLVSDGAWGEGGNGLLLGGGQVRFELRQAGNHHAFGVSAVDRTSRTPIFTTQTANEGDELVMTPPGEPYLLYFENVIPSTGVVFSDGTADPGLDMLVFQNAQDPEVFALLFDDGGAGPDRDYDDLVVTARGEVNTQCRVESLLARTSEALPRASQCGGTDSGVIPGILTNLQAVNAVLAGSPGDFDDTVRNVTGEIEARVESAIFMACKLIGGDHPACPVQPGDTHY